MKGKDRLPRASGKSLRCLRHRNDMRRVDMHIRCHVHFFVPDGIL